jgi:hypothetical protein
LSCIVAITDGSSVMMGADSVGADTGQWTVSERRDPKLFRNGPFLIGFTSSFRMGQILRYGFRPPERKPDIPTEEYMATAFVDAVRKALADGGFRKKENEVERGGTFLVGYRGRIFEVDDDFQVGETAEAFAAVGCGSAFAMGSLFTSQGEDRVKRLELALQAAHRYSAYVRPPFIFAAEG